MEFTQKKKKIRMASESIYIYIYIYILKSGSHAKLRCHVHTTGGLPREMLDGSINV